MSLPGPGWRASVRGRVGFDDLPVVALATYVIALLAWLAIVNRWLPMAGSGAAPMRMSEPGVPEAMALANGAAGVGLYLLMWAVMMIAMMYPTSTPLFSLYYRTLDGATRAGRTARVGAFMGTYALVWALTGLVPLGVNLVVPLRAVAATHGPALLGGSLLLLAAYQVSPYKHRCLRYCRSPMGFLMSHQRPGVRGAVRTSWSFSVLFAFMVVVGSMNLVWMALITVVLSLERAVAWGDRLARATGVVAGVAGVGLLLTAVI